MARYELENETKILIEQYNLSHAESISKDLFGGLDVTVVIQQREDLLASGPEEAYSVCCLSEGSVIGICTGVRKRWFAERHRIEIVQVVVKKEFRGLGVATLMMREIIHHFIQFGIEIVQISVEERNIGAMKAYQKIGFEKYGILKNGLKQDDIYSDEIMLAASVHAILE